MFCSISSFFFRCEIYIMHILRVTSQTRCSHIYFMSDTFPKWKHLTADWKCCCKASHCKQFSSTLRPSVQATEFSLTKKPYEFTVCRVLSAILHNGKNENSHSPKVNTWYCNLVVCLSCVLANNDFTGLAHLVSGWANCYE